MDKIILEAINYDVDNMVAIANVIDEVGLPAGDYMDKDRLINMVDDECLSEDDLIEAVVETTNALLKIRNLLN